MKLFKKILEIFCISFLALVLISFTLLFRINIFGQHSNGGYPFEIDSHQKLNLLGFLGDFLFYFIIIYGLNQLLKKIFKWKIFKVLPQIGAIIIFIILAGDSFLSFINENCNETEFLKTSKELEKSLSEIPNDKLFYYYQKEKIHLSRRRNKCGHIYFVSGLGNAKIYIQNELALGFIKNLPESKKDEIINKEKLVRNKNYEPIYWVKTTDGSKYLNAMEESIYLAEKYPELEYADPNMTYSEKPQGLIEYLKSETFRLIFNTRYQAKDSSELADIELPEKVYDEQIKDIHEFSNKTLKEHINDFYKRNPTTDLKLIEFNSGNFDMDGKTSSGASFIMFSKEQKMLYIYSVIGNQIETYTQPTDGLIDYKSYNLGEIKDSPEIIKEAINQKNDCSGFLDLNLFQDKPEYVTVECVKKTGLEEKEWTTQIPIRNE